MSMELIIAIMIGLPIIYILIDVYLAVNNRPGDTFSEIIRDASRKFMPLAIFISTGFGILLGHWFW